MHLCSNPLRIDFCNSSFAAIIIIMSLFIFIQPYFTKCSERFTNHYAKSLLRNLFTMSNLETKTDYISLAN